MEPKTNGSRLEEESLQRPNQWHGVEVLLQHRRLIDAGKVEYSCKCLPNPHMAEIARKGVLKRADLEINQQGKQ